MGTRINRLLLCLLAAAVLPAAADTFKSGAECAVGKRVSTSDHKVGRITRIDDTKTTCYVLVDGAARDAAYLFWMLAAEGVSRETSDKLVPGVYECFGNGRYTFIDVRVTGPNSYESAGTKGTFTVDSTNRIVFQGGSLAAYHAKLLQGPTIGLNSNGDSFYATTCEYNKNRK